MAEIVRVTRSKNAARASYNRLSQVYDLMVGGSEEKIRESGLEFLNVQASETVLEIGPGTGKALLELARSVGPGGRAYGLDISDGMLSVAGDRLRKAGLLDRVQLGCADAVKLPLPTDSIDAIYLCFTLELFDIYEIPLVLGECCRLLHQKGRICVVGMSRKGKPNPMVRLYEWAHARIPNYVDCRPIQVREAMEAAGFTTIKSSLWSLWGLPVEVVLSQK